MNSFNNKVVWITGASSGIGEALAKAFAKEGAKLILSARRESELQRVNKQLALASEKVLVLPLDLGNASTISEHIHKAINTFGNIDILVCNGGISQRSWAKETPLEVDRKIMEINFFGTIALAKSVLPYMLNKQQGHIVITSSIAGKFGFYLRSTYSASKHALHGFFESLRMEVYKENIKIMLVCPGKIKTNISQNAITESGDRHNKMDRSTDLGLSAEACAEQILKGIKNNTEELYVGGKELKAIWVKRFFPKLFSKLIRKQIPE